MIAPNRIMIRHGNFACPGIPRDTNRQNPSLQIELAYMTSIAQDGSVIPDNIEYGVITTQFDSPLSGMSKGRRWVTAVLTVNVLQLKAKAGQGIVMREMVWGAEGQYEVLVQKEAIGRVRSKQGIGVPSRYL